MSIPYHPPQEEVAWVDYNPYDYLPSYEEELELDAEYGGLDTPRYQPDVLDDIQDKLEGR